MLVNMKILTYALVTCGIVMLGMVWWINRQANTIEDLRTDKVILEANNATYLAALERQNGEIAEIGAITAQNLEASQEALEAALAGRADLQARVAGLLSRPVPDDPGEACVAADAIILEFYQ
jgi:hypothetical protein